MNPPPNARPIDSAAIVLLCDGPTGPEVFMLRRHDKMATHAGAYVFPGGKVEAADAGFHGGGRLDQPSAALRQALDEPGLDEAAATSLYVAAIRETFEECGVLLAHRPGEEDRAPTIAPHTGAFAELLAQGALVPSTRRLRPWSHWTTPVNSFTSVRRFDTRFFVAALPPGQQAVHDDAESSGSTWIAPREALQRYRQGETTLMPPQLLTLSQLASHASVAAILQDAGQRAPFHILPMTIDENGQRFVVYPGDARHTEPNPAMPGPSRLKVLADGRYEPVDGDWSVLIP